VLKLKSFIIPRNNRRRRSVLGVRKCDFRGLGANPQSLKWFAEAERVHARWAMLAVAGILAQVSKTRRALLYQAAVSYSQWQ
jgi:hypothetical protein